MPIHDDDYALHREIIEALLSSNHPLDRRVVNRIKNKICGKHRCARVPSNPDILQAAIPEEIEVLRPFLQKRPVRTVSGVAVVATMTEPYACPHGKCAYCPGGPEAGVPQSYTGHEPATMRGLQHEFDPYRQTESRLNQLRTIGHSIEKVELIVMGGDWCSKPSEYRESFVKGCLDAMNGVRSKNLDEAKVLNESSEVRNVGMTFETRPDWVTEASLDDMLEMGATRVEIGVQTLSDDVLELVERGHDVEATIQATKLLRDSGLKVAYHMMPGLPGSGKKKDINSFKKIFSDNNFKPDMLKIYPCMVLKGTKVYKWWKNKTYTPLTTKKAIEIITEIKRFVPRYVRIMRVQRDIPIQVTEAGVDRNNLRQYVEKALEEKQIKCKCIRCREVGHKIKKEKIKVDSKNVKLNVFDYDASNGKEFFISFDDMKNDALIGFCRLRFPNQCLRKEITKNSALIRELHVFGSAVSIGVKGDIQHAGYGRKLLKKAEQISIKNKKDKIVVISGIGVRNYYRKFGYKKQGPYMVKKLK